MFRNMKIKTKIIFIYIALLLALFALTFSLLSLINAGYAKRTVGEGGVQTVSALRGNLSFIFENVTQVSNLVYFDSDIQKSLRQIASEEIDPLLQNGLRKSLINMVLSGNYVSGAYIFDAFGNVYHSYKQPTTAIRTAHIPETGWYREMMSAGGNGFFIHQSEDVLTFHGDNNYISYIREIRDQNTYLPLAALLVTIDAKTIQDRFFEVGAPYENQFLIYSEQDGYIIPPSDNAPEFLAELQSNPPPKGSYQSTSVAGEPMILVAQELGIRDWQLVGAFRMNAIRALAPYYTTAILMIMLLNVLFVFVCAMALTRLIFKPLSRVERFMQLAETGQFCKMPVEDGQNEITSLQRVFNQMTGSIENLITTVKDEERVIARGKLELITAQINPHFLYNTLDAISALALTENYNDCFQMTQALGSFYRNSLNSGLDFISISDELDCIRSYLTILNIRYDGKITFTAHADPELLPCPILKLLLQPLVENAVHHGIKGKGTGGKIDIQVLEDDTELIFCVSDDGCGMSEECIADVMAGRTVTGKSGFGIYSLKQRVSLYYGIEEPISIHSELGNGTEVTIRIKRMEGNGHGH